MIKIYKNISSYYQKFNFSKFLPFTNEIYFERFSLNKFMKIFLTGGTGYIGTNFIKYALKKNQKFMQLVDEKNKKKNYFGSWSYR